MSASADRGTEDKLLLLQLQQGSQAAFTALYQSYSKTIYRKIMRMVGDEDKTRELVQDVFIKVWDKRDRIDTSKSFRSWLFTIAVNLVYDEFRQAARDKTLENRLIALSAKHYTIEQESTVSDEQLDAINQVIALLPPQRKKIFMLCKSEGMSYEEVSKTLNISTATVRDHMVKANKTIQQYLQANPDIALYSMISAVFFILK
jgi:RNA polymerase sigma-70 factor (family 1)